MLGRKVKTLLDKEVNTGKMIVDWDGTNDVGLPVSSGIYIIRLYTIREALTRKIALIK